MEDDKNHKPRLLFVFAHPDDDAFGPSGTLIKMSDEYDVHFLCVTKGQRGENHSDERVGSLGETREQEAQASAKIIGAKSLSFLSFTDGELCNNLYGEIVKGIQTHVDSLQPSILMTWEPKGVTGHIDHIVVSLVCHFVFYKNPKIEKLMLYCLSQYQTRQFLSDYFIYRPVGYKPSEIDLVVDISEVWDQKIESIKCHKTQIKDFKKILNRPKIRLMEDCFIILKQP